MKTSDLLSMCLRNLIRRKFLTSLTIVGVVIGTTAIVMMISLVIGMGNQIDEQLKMWGDLSIIEVWGGGTGSNDTPLDDKAVADIRNIQGVLVATPFVGLQTGSEYLIEGGRNFRYEWKHPNFFGIVPEAMEPLGYRIAEGEFLPLGKTRTLQVVVGGSAAYRFMDTRRRFDNMRSDWPDEDGNIQEPFFNPMKTDLKLTLKSLDAEDTTTRNLEYEIIAVGILEADRTKWETVDGVFIPLDEMKRLQDEFNKENNIRTPRNQKESYNQVKVKSTDLPSVPDIEKEIQAMGFGTWSMESQRQQMQQSIMTMQIILGGIGGITLFVSAISITNTMIMSVYERTREIGVMKVLGCIVGNIRAIFLIEAGLIGFFGGVLGVLFSFLLSFFINAVGGGMTGGGMGGMLGGIGSVSSIPLWLVLLGLAFATGIGLAAGFYPANRAVKISALEAIKQE
ncbi:MAG: ABC transporter permease [Oscillospiraceae bacterium]|nr:ABC transporter permease [Oscillospiraceae bacterium]